MPPPKNVFAAVNEAVIYKTLENNHAKTPVNRVLMGTYLKIIGEQGDWYQTDAFKLTGWIKKSETSLESPYLKIFYLDVGQGDGSLIEVGNSLRMLIDGGPSNNMLGYLTKWQYKYLLDQNQKIHIDYIFVSHFDADHYKGLIKIIADTRFTFKRIYHAGILKYHSTKKPASYNTILGKTIVVDGKKFLDNISSSLLTIPESEINTMQDLQEDFIRAVKKAKSEGRLESAVRLDQDSETFLEEEIEGIPFSITALGPLKTKKGTKNLLRYFQDESHTINGNSLVLQLKFGANSFLFGGDLNSEAETELLTHYDSNNPFETDVAKACHHGSGDFTTDFMSKVNPFASVISSGDNESYAHPRADALGCAGKYSRGDRPKVFSTELARSTNINNGTILFGLINLRSNGQKIYMAQMKEVHSNADLWDAYEVK